MYEPILSEINKYQKGRPALLILIDAANHPHVIRSNISHKDTIALFIKLILENPL